MDNERLARFAIMSAGLIMGAAVGAAGGAGAAMKLERSQSQAALSAAEEAAERYLNRGEAILMTERGLHDDARREAEECKLLLRLYAPHELPLE